jgi:hypothetical protein
MGWRAVAFSPPNLAFSQFRLKARIWHLEGSAPSGLNQINSLYIYLLWNTPILAHHLTLKRTGVILLPSQVSRILIIFVLNSLLFS